LLPRRMLPLVLVYGLLGGLWSTPAFAQKLGVKIDRETISSNEAFELTVQVNGRHAVLKLPKTSDFTIENSTSQFNQPIFCMNMGMEVIHGPCVYSFHFVPRKTGSLTIPALTLVDNFWNQGRLLAKSEPITVTVTDDKVPNGHKRKGKTGKRRPRGSQRQRQPKRQGGPLVPPEKQEVVTLETLRQSMESPSPYSEYDLVLLPRLSRDSITLNEPFRVDFILLVSKQSGASQLQGLEMPELDGFRKERLEIAQAEEQPVRLGGKRYDTYVLARFILIPMEPGKKLLEGAKATVLASVSSIQQYGGGGFSISVSGGSQPVDVFAPPLRLTINEVPKPVPEGFDAGNIGKFTISNVVAPDAQPAGTWMMYKYRISGQGNLLSLVPPELPRQAGLETRRPYLDSSNIKVDESGIHGEIEVQLPFRITNVGTYDPGNLELIFFDPDDGAFERVPVELPPVTTTRPDEAEDLEQLPGNHDLDGIISDGKLLAARPDSPRETARLVLALVLGLLGLYGISLLVRVGLRMRNHDPIRRRRRQALVASRRALKEVATHLESGDTRKFHDTLARSFENYLEGRFGISMGSATHTEIGTHLTRHGLSDELCRKVLEELESAEYGRFAPSALQRADMQQARSRVLDLINQLDRQKTGSL
jgi:hypothetical protein